MMRERFEAVRNYSGWTVMKVEWDDSTPMPYLQYTQLTTCSTLEECAAYLAQMGKPVRVALT